MVLDLSLESEPLLVVSFDLPLPGLDLFSESGHLGKGLHIAEELRLVLLDVGLCLDHGYRSLDILWLGILGRLGSRYLTFI